MDNLLSCVAKEREELSRLSALVCSRLRCPGSSDGADKDTDCLYDIVQMAAESGMRDDASRDEFGNNVPLLGLQTAVIIAEETCLGGEAVVAELLWSLVRSRKEPYSGTDGEWECQDAGGCKRLPAIESTAGGWRQCLAEDMAESVKGIVDGLRKVDDFYSKAAVSSGTPCDDNFRNLLLSSAGDMRVVLIIIAERVCLMRLLRDTPNIAAREKVSREALNLYAPLAHKLGLYLLKSELEDLSLKYLEHDAYYMIRENLNSTKQARDAYISRFVGPVSVELEKYGLHFHIKGRTKSIFSIWQKMKKQQCGFSGIYDLFAIRIILSSPPEREKADCWQVFSIITNMYVSNPKRMRDWLSCPKSNGYESLHITVLGPENKWVEVQIRSERMDEIAERGVAAHWRYKGVKDAGGMDMWLVGIRRALEAGEERELRDDCPVDMTAQKVYVFSPKGDLYKLSAGATVLDFAWYVHSEVGGHCVGGKVNGRIVSIKEALHSGDQVEILTSNSQTPKPDWLGIVKTARAKSKLRQALKECLLKETSAAKELFGRRLKNRKADYDEATAAHVVNRLGYKSATDFYMDIAHGRLDVNTAIEKYLEIRSVSAAVPSAAVRSAEGYVFDNSANEILPGGDDTLVIADAGVKGVDYTLAKCCNPIYGDDVFGFVTVNGGIKIHRADCPNAPDLRSRFSYRIVKARWSGKGTQQYTVTIRVTGNDDIGIVNNITSIISKEEKTVIRSINIDSDDGLFSGVIVLMVEDTFKMNRLIKKIGTVKGVRHVERI